MPVGVYKRKRKIQPSKKCITCGDSFSKKPRSSHAQWSKRVICGNKCRRLSQEQKDIVAAAQRGRKHSPEEIKKRVAHFTGEKSPHWQGGLTSINKSIRCMPEYKEWRKSVFERDNWTCIDCGIRSGKGQSVVLNADHIVPLCFIVGLESIKTKEQARNVKILWSLDNGRTLCEECHSKTYFYKERAKLFESELKKNGYKVVKD